MPFDNPLADGQPDSRARIFLACVQPLKHAEHALEVSGRDPDAVIADRDSPFFAFLLRGNVDLRTAVAAILQGIANQVLQQLVELSGIAHDQWKWIVRDLCLAFVNRACKVGQNQAERFLQIDRLEFLASRADPRVSEESIDQRLHAFGSVDSLPNVLVGFFPELPCISPLQQLAIAGDCP